jgi:FAD-dependent urate hydroxylase
VHGVQPRWCKTPCALHDQTILPTGLVKITDPDTDACRALRLIGPNPHGWVPDCPGIKHNAAIVGGGQTGNTLAFTLRLAGIGKATVPDAAPSVRAS